jgi:hypothetical protein
MGGVGLPGSIKVLVIGGYFHDCYALPRFTGINFRCAVMAGEGGLLGTVGHRLVWGLRVVFLIDKNNLQSSSI